MPNYPLVLGDMADSPSGPWICSIVSSATSSHETVPLLISLLRISSSSSSGLYCDDMPYALYHMLFAVVKGGKTLSGDVQIRSRKSVLLILSIHSEKIIVCSLQHIALIRRIHCLKHGLRLIDVKVRAGRSQEEGQGSFVDNSDEGSFGFKGQRLPSL